MLKELYNCYCGVPVAQHLTGQVVWALALFVVVASKKSKKEEIDDFIEMYFPCYKEVPVATMRHIIPLLLMEIYPHHYGRFSRKGEVWKL